MYGSAFVGHTQRQIICVLKPLANASHLTDHPHPEQSFFPLASYLPPVQADRGLVSQNKRRRAITHGNGTAGHKERPSGNQILKPPSTLIAFSLWRRPLWAHSLPPYLGALAARGLIRERTWLPDPHAAHRSAYREEHPERIYQGAQLSDDGSTLHAATFSEAHLELRAVDNPPYHRTLPSQTIRARVLMVPGGNSDKGDSS